MAANSMGNQSAGAAKGRLANRNFGIRARILVAGSAAILLIVGCGGWAASAKVSGAVVSQGKVTVKHNVKQVQHRDGGIVSEILVDHGDVVDEGAVLLRLDETQTRAELGVIQAQLAELRGREGRLRAERDGLAELSFDKLDSSFKTRGEIEEGERRLFGNNLATREAQREQLLSQMVQFEEQIRGLVAQRDSHKTEGAMIAEDLEKLRPLVKKQILEGSRTRTLERELARIDGLTGEIEANIARVTGQISEAKLKIIELDQQVRTDAQRELRDVEGRIAELRERVVAAKDRLSRMEVRAPVSGFVNELRVHTVGGVISAGETVMTIVPEGEQLLVEARLAPQDIDQVRPGQTAKLRFSAFNQRTTPEIAGTVEVVSAAASVDNNTGEAFYLASIAISDEGELAGKILIPGMPVEVFLQTGERTALSYLVKPFADQMERALRED